MIQPVSEGIHIMPVFEQLNAQKTCIILFIDIKSMR